MTDFDNYHGCLDIPDSRDITVEELELLGASELPIKVKFENTPILSQGQIGACTVF